MSVGGQVVVLGREGIDSQGAGAGLPLQARVDVGEQGGRSAVGEATCAVHDVGT
ncbi:hypothetical protein ABZY09_46545 [Streptomyces sp. NPDC002928]|uniref:hypothetical protein n=1 Tax=Streptomyces sp. NPDC002928 TaxID=3154440 RepID=UPI0033A7E018